MGLDSNEALEIVEGSSRVMTRSKVLPTQPQKINHESESSIDHSQSSTIQFKEDPDEFQIDQTFNTDSNFDIDLPFCNEPLTNIKLDKASPKIQN